MAKTVVIFEGEEYSGESLTDRELTVLHAQLPMLSADNGFLTQLFNDNLGKIQGALEVAKADIGGPFTGLSAGDSELGMQIIRPGYVRRSTAATEAITNDWAFTFAVTTDYWLGFGTDNTTAINVDKRILVMPMAVGWTQGPNPVVEELLIQLGQTTYPVNVIRHGWYADNPNRIRAARIRPMVWRPKSRPLVQTNQVNAGVDQLVLLGLTFGKGDLLRTLAPSTIQT